MTPVLPEKLGLLRFILSKNPFQIEAREARNKEKRTLLHAICLEFPGGNHQFGQKLVRLLLEKKFDPSIRDILGKKPMEYLAPQSAMYQLLMKPPGEFQQNMPR